MNIGKLGIVIILYIFISYHNVYAQDSSSFSKDNYKNNFSSQSDIDYDSIWCFHPFSINIYAGAWVPVGKLNNYYNSSLKLGASFGLMITKNVKIELGLSPIFQNNRKELDILVKDSIITTKNTSGMSMGGYVSYAIYKDNNLFFDLISGVTWETISTGIENPSNNPNDKYDSVLEISTYGISFGIDIWINKFGNHNLGVRLLYTYAAYDNDNLLSNKIGNHYISTSLIYRFPRRKQIFRKYY